MIVMMTLFRYDDDDDSFSMSDSKLESENIYKVLNGLTLEFACEMKSNGIFIDLVRKSESVFLMPVRRKASLYTCLTIFI